VIPSRRPTRRSGVRSRDTDEDLVAAVVDHVALHRHAELPSLRPDDVLVDVGVGPHGEAIALWARPDDRRLLTAWTTSAGGVRSADPAPERPATAYATVLGAGLARTVPLPGLRVAHPFVQPAPDGGVLLVGARCRWTPGGADRNAVVVDADGTQVAAATLGDGIAHVQCTAAGDVWVGYTDEGVYGNLGWGGPGPPPVGRFGLVRFDRRLSLAWEFDPGGAPLGDISACYALNVGEGEVWVSYYTGFPLARVAGDDVRGWRCDVAGARALVVGEGRAALVGGYRGERDRIVVGRLGDGAFLPERTARLSVDGGELPPALLVGRGSDLHVLAGRTWYRADIDHLSG